MRRTLLWAVALALVGAAWFGATSARATNNYLRAVGIDIPPAALQNQPSSIGDFKGTVGMGDFAAGPGSNFSSFESDDRFMQGTVKNQLTGKDQSGQWGFI